MMNYHEIITQGEERQCLYLATAEQRRLLASIEPDQPHPLLTWVGQRLIRWGQQLLGEKRTPGFPIIPATFSR